MATKQTRQRRQEELSKKLGDMLFSAVNVHVEELVFTTKRMGDYIIILAVENADGKYIINEDGEFEWEVPETWGMLHFEVFVLDRDYKLFIPGLEISSKVFTIDKVLVSQQDAKYIWHPYAQHYGFDAQLTEEGKYIVELTIKHPTFDRMLKNIGKRYTDEITVRMESIQLMPPGANDEEPLFDRKEME